MQLSLVLPCFNEEKNIEATVGAVDAWLTEKGIDGEIIVVNDGSTDRTFEVLRSTKASFPRLIVLTHQENKGYGAALLTGLDATKGEVMGFMDSDGQFHPQDFSVLLPQLDIFPFVTGRRIHRADPFMRKLNALLFGLLSFLILGIWVRDVNCAMKLWKREYWSVIRPRIATGALVNAEMFYRLKRAGIAWKQVNVSHYPRKYGAQTGAKLSVIVRMFIELLTLRFSPIEQ